MGGSRESAQTMGVDDAAAAASASIWADVAGDKNRVEPSDSITCTDGEGSGECGECAAALADGGTVALEAIWDRAVADALERIKGAAARTASITAGARGVAAGTRG